MALLRSGSAKSTLSMMQRKATRYQKYLTMASVFLVITSTIVIFTAVILLKFYFLSNLYFWSEFFHITPIFMIVLGVYKFIIALYGAGIAGYENRGLLIFFAVLLALAFIAQIASIFTAIEVRTTIGLGNYRGANIVESLKQYNVDSGITAGWDSMQEQLRCCGGTNYEQGYTDYRNTPIGSEEDSVPDSCCLNPGVGCGRNIFRLTKEQIRKVIFTDGCLTALMRRLQDDVVPMMAVYAGVGVLIALTELIAVVLTCAFVAQINRRRQREEKMWNAVRGEDDLDHEGAARNLNTPLSNEHETMC